MYQNYFKFMVEIIIILKSVKTFLNVLEKYKKEEGNYMAADVAQREYSNIKCYASAFSNIYMLTNICH